MQPRKIAIVAVLIGAFCSGTFVLGQQNADNTGLTGKEFSRLFSAAEVDNDQLDALFDAYAKLPGNAEASKQAARIAWVESQKGNNSTFSIIQTMQNQKIIEQNQKLIEQNARVVELLEKNAKK